MATQNYWRKLAKSANRNTNSPEFKKKEIDKKVTSATLWLIASGILILFYGIAIMNGYTILDLSAIAILLIVLIFFIYSIFHLRQVRKEQDTIYASLPHHLREKKNFFQKYLH